MRRLCVITLVCLLGLVAACQTEKNITVKTTPDRESVQTPTPTSQTVSIQATSPQETFKGFRDAMIRGDLETVKSLTHSYERKACDWGHFRINYHTNRDAIIEIFEGAEVADLEMSTDGATAMVRWGNGKMQVMRFTYEDGLWRVGGDKHLAAKMKRTSPVPASAPPRR